MTDAEAQMESRIMMTVVTMPMMSVVTMPARGQCCVTCTECQRQGGNGQNCGLFHRDVLITNDRAGDVATCTADNAALFVAALVPRCARAGLLGQRGPATRASSART